jgi:hypothetical protein
MQVKSGASHRRSIKTPCSNLPAASIPSTLKLSEKLETGRSLSSTIDVGVILKCG